MKEKICFATRLETERENMQASTRTAEQGESLLNYNSEEEHYMYLLKDSKTQSVSCFIIFIIRTEEEEELRLFMDAQNCFLPEDSPEKKFIVR